MLRITLQESDSVTAVVLEGRLAGPWAEELNRVWVETAPRLGSRKLSIDLRNVTYVDAVGKRVLKEIFSQADAELVASSLGMQDVAKEILGN
jgi:anti-anti-sigma regulatory factor